MKVRVMGRRVDLSTLTTTKLQYNGVYIDIDPKIWEKIEGGQKFAYYKLLKNTIDFYAQKEGNYKLIKMTGDKIVYLDMDNPRYEFEFKFVG